MDFNGHTDISLEQAPFLLIGSCEAPWLERVRGILDVVLAQPGRWHSAWTGRHVLGVALSPRSAACKTITGWVADRQLNAGRCANTPGDTMDPDPWGALLLGRTPADLECAAVCLENGVPVVSVDFSSLEIVQVAAADVVQWKRRAASSHDKNIASELAVSEVHDMNDEDDKSPFLVNSVTLPRELESKTALVGRNGEQCGFSRSQAERAG
jgi:hypothetical protein